MKIRYGISKEGKAERTMRIHAESLIKEKEALFSDFVLRCARSFDALITMKGEPIDCEIPEEFKPSLYHEEKLKEAKEMLSLFDRLRDEDFRLMAAKEFQKGLKEYNSAMEEHNFMRKRYESMLEKIEKWNPPSVDHRGLKTFMFDGIKSELILGLGSPVKPTIKTIEEKKSEELESIANDIQYHQEEDGKEKATVRRRNIWLKQLRESIEE